jgi:hypothetical protein
MVRSAEMEAQDVSVVTRLIDMAQFHGIMLREAKLGESALHDRLV